MAGSEISTSRSVSYASVTAMSEDDFEPGTALIPEAGQRKRSIQVGRRRLDFFACRSRCFGTAVFVAGVLLVAAVAASTRVLVHHQLRRSNVAAHMKLKDEVKQHTNHEESKDSSHSVSKKKNENELVEYKEENLGDFRCEVRPDTDFVGDFFMKVEHAFSPLMCCGECEARDKCVAWSWGAKRGVKGLTDVCFLKSLTKDGELPAAKKAEGVVSGRPGRKTHKYGIAYPPPSKNSRTLGVKAKKVKPTSATPTCPGNIAIDGLGEVALVNAKKSWVEAKQGDLVLLHGGARTYSGEWCSEDGYNNTQYSALKLLGKTLRYTTDISGTGCGCNAALYLTAMRQNADPGKCWEYYCDAMSVCGVPCAEIDIQEANQYAFLSTMHAFSKSGPDKLGRYAGYGQSLPGDKPARGWTDKEYGWGAHCVDTAKPFNVAVSFPADDNGDLVAMKLELSQPDKPCSVSSTIGDYKYWSKDHKHHNGLKELTETLKQGMTLVMSYWNSSGLLWMDGLGSDGKGPCVEAHPKQCTEHVRFFNFSIEELTPNPVDCAWGSWQAWSDCSATCHGQRQRKREIHVHPKHGGSSCSGEAADSKPCNEGDCAPPTEAPVIRPVNRTSTTEAPPRSSAQFGAAPWQVGAAALLAPMLVAYPTI